jgi:hypothetical protein
MDFLGVVVSPDDFKALVFKTGKGKPKCLEV